MKHLRQESVNKKIAEELLKSQSLVCRDTDVLAELLETDLRENLPVQILALIQSVFSAIEDLEEGRIL